MVLKKMAVGRVHSIHSRVKVIVAPLNCIFKIDD
jgi:hypothetical protein